MDPKTPPTLTDEQKQEYDRRRFEWLKKYLSTLDPAQQKAFAMRCGTSLGYLRKALYAKPLFDAGLCRRLDEQSGGAVPRESLRPDVWPLGDPVFGHWVEINIRQWGINDRRRLGTAQTGIACTPESDTGM